MEEMFAFSQIGNKNLCLICYNPFEEFPLPPLRADLWGKIFHNCSKHLHAAITKDPLSGTDIFSRSNECNVNISPFCQHCFNSSLELCQLTDQLEIFQKEITDLILTFSLSVLNRRTQTHAGNQRASHNYNNTCEIDITGLGLQFAESQESNQYPNNYNANSQLNSSTFNFSDSAANVENIVVQCEVPPPIAIREVVPMFNGFFQNYGNYLGAPSQFIPPPGLNSQSTATSQPIKKRRKRKPKLNLSPEALKQMMMADMENRTAEVKVPILLFDVNGKPIIPKEIIRRKRQRPLKPTPILASLLEGNEENRDLENVEPIGDNNDNANSSQLNESDGSSEDRANDTTTPQVMQKPESPNLSIRMPSVPNPFKNLGQLSENNTAKPGDNNGARRSRRHHIQFKCKQCNKGFKYLQFLQYHEKTHDQKKHKAFKCSKCGKSFTNRTSLIQHLNAHEGNKPYECHLCNYKTAWPTNLQAHLCTHSSERYECRYCGKVCKTYITGAHHLKKLHPDQPVSKDGFIIIVNGSAAKD